MAAISTQPGKTSATVGSSFGGLPRAVAEVSRRTGDRFRFDVRVEPHPHILAGLVIVSTALTSQFPALHAIGQLNLVETVRDRSQ